MSSAVQLVVELMKAARRLRLRCGVELPLKSPDRQWSCQAHANLLILVLARSIPEVRRRPSAGLSPVSSVPWASPTPGGTGTERAVASRDPASQSGSPTLPREPSSRAAPNTPAPVPGAVVGCFPETHRPSPRSGQVGGRISTFEACLGFTARCSPRVCSDTTTCGPLSPSLKTGELPHPPHG